MFIIGDMAWLILFLAGLCEIGWAVGLKLSAGFTRPLHATWTLVVMIASVVLLARAMRTLPLGTSYAVWTGIGAVGTAIAGMLFFGESRSALRLLFISLIIVGILGLKWVAGKAH